MHPRLELDKVAPDTLKAVLQVSAFINNHSGLEPILLNLVYLRASQINGCAWCIDMHTKDARALREPNSGGTRSAGGGTFRSIAIGSGPPWHGPRR